MYLCHDMATGWTFLVFYLDFSECLYLYFISSLEIVCFLCHFYYCLSVVDVGSTLLLRLVGLTSGTSSNDKGQFLQHVLSFLSATYFVSGRKNRARPSICLFAHLIFLMLIVYNCILLNSCH